jgi:RNA polymerase sigma factor (sigma-70 family)
MATRPFDLAIILAKQGDKEALAEIYTTIRPLLLSYVRSLLYSDDISEDIVSEVLYIMVRDIQKMRLYNGKAFYGWLKTIAYNKAMDHLRSKVRTTDPLDRSNPRSWDDPALTIETAERNIIVHEAVKSLPGKTRNVIIGSFVDGLPTCTLARMAGKSESAIRQIKSRGLKVLRHILSPRMIAAILSCGLLTSGGFLFFYERSLATPQATLSRVIEIIFPGDSHGTTPRQMPMEAPTLAPRPTATPSPSPSPTPTPLPSPTPVTTSTKSGNKQPVSQPPTQSIVPLPSVCAQGICPLR